MLHQRDSKCRVLYLVVSTQAKVTLYRDFRVQKNETDKLLISNHMNVIPDFSGCILYKTR